MTLIIYGFVAFLLIGIAVVVFIYYSNKKMLKSELQKKQLEIDYERNLLKNTILSQEEERSRIARELHDAISSKLNVVLLNTGQAKELVKDNEQAMQILNTVTEQCKETLTDSRQIAHDLIPPVLEKFGLFAAINEFCTNINASGKLRVNFSHAIEDNEIASDKQLHIFRIVQELLNNTLKHSDGSKADIRFEKGKNRYVCIYEDNGTGFDHEKALEKPGLGLKNLQTRVSFLGSEVVFAKSDNKGTQISFGF